jgi:UDP-glucose 4-epimerase
VETAPRAGYPAPMTWRGNPCSDRVRAAAQGINSGDRDRSEAMRIAITGASERIGRALYLHLSEHHDVVGLDRSPSPTADVTGDLEDPAAIDALLDGADAVIHAAALHAPHVGRAPASDFERINVRATARLLQACIDRRITRFVLTSTTALYGDVVRDATSHGAAAWIDETVAPRPTTIYHRTKLSAEGLVQSAAERGALAGVVLRMSRCFPEPANVMACYRLHRGSDARDVASAHRWAVEHLRTGFHRFVVSGATPFTKGDLGALARDAPGVLRRRAPGLVAAFERRGWRLPQRIDRVYAARALQSLGWNPQFGFEEILRELDQTSGNVLLPREFDS